MSANGRTVTRMSNPLPRVGQGADAQAVTAHRRVPGSTSYREIRAHTNHQLSSRSAPFDVRWDAELFQLHRYRTVFERLRLRARLDPALCHSAPGDSRLTLSWVLDHQAQVTDAILASIDRDDFAFGPHRRTRLALAGKLRDLLVPSWPDRILLMVMATLLIERSAAVVSRRVFSFQKGRSARMALRELAFWLRERKGQPLHIARRDIEKYGDGIVHEKLLTTLMRLPGFGESRRYRALLMQAIDPPRLDEQHLPTRIGLPAGSPIVPPLENLYLVPLDEVMAMRPGLFYARYGDDFVVASSNRAEFELATHLIDQQISRLSLRCGDDKRIDRTLSPADDPRRSAIEWLGMRVLAGGEIGTKFARFADCRRQLKQTISSLIERACRQFPSGSDAHTRFLRTGLSQLVLDLRSRHLPELIHQQNNPQLVAELDRLMASVSVRALERHAGLRRRPAWQLYRKLAVPSLTHRFREVNYGARHVTRSA